MVDPQNPRSTARIAGHPLHPFLIPFPMVSFIGAFAADIVYALTEETFWADAAWWLLAVGLVTALLAAATGIIDYLGDERIRRLGAARRHAIANIIVVALEGANLWQRSEGFWPPEDMSLSLILSGLATLILLYSGWMGGSLVYRHGVAVRSPGHDPLDPDEHSHPATQRPR